MCMSKFFLLGVGAQKAGTTWLHRYLSRFETADFGDLKEYHVWDAIKLPEMNKFDMRPGLTTLRGAKQTLGRLPLISRGTSRLRGNLQRNPDDYFLYFQNLLSRPGIRLTGDITPSYSGLDAPTLSLIKTRFETLGIDSKVAFLMRNPVDRCWSAIRMHRRKGNRKSALAEGIDLSLDDEGALRAYVLTEQASLRTRYHVTLNRLESVFPTQRMFVSFYEELFSAAKIERLSHFFEVEPDLSFSGERINASLPAALSEGTRRHVETAFADVYEEIFARFPQAERLWAKGAT